MRRESATKSSDSRRHRTGTEARFLEFLPQSMNPTHAARMEIFRKAGLYLVTSSAFSAGRSTLDVLERALDAGVRLVQLREKDVEDDVFLQLAEKTRDLTARFGALMIVNDRLNVAMRCGADGVHLGRHDLPVAEARSSAPEMIIGASTHSVDEAKGAVAAGASYINIGPLFRTSTKAWDGPFLGIEGLRDIAAAATVPFTVMGGIKLEHVPLLMEAGACAVAVVTAVTQAQDPGVAARRFLDAIAAARKG